MVSADAARTIVGIIGNITALFLFLSPVPTFIRIWKKGSVEQYAATPYLAAEVNCMVWVLYGLPLVHPNSILVLTINGTGAAIELVYIILFVIYSDSRRRIKLLLITLVELIFIAILSLLVLTVVHTTQKRSTVAGTIGVLFNIIMYASPLSVMNLVITTKSVEYMPFTLSFASFANGLCWTAYALIRLDLFIVIPNGLGSLFGIAQLILYAAYYKSTKRQIAAERKGKGDMGLVEVVVSGAGDDTRKIGGCLCNP